MESIMNMIMSRYSEEVDTDIVLDDIIQTSISEASNLISIIDYLFSLEKEHKDYKTIYDKCIKSLMIINENIIGSMALFLETDFQESIDMLAENIGIYNLDYYNKQTIYTKINSYIKFKHKNLLKSGITMAIGGGIKFDLDFNNIKEQLFDLLFYHALIISSIRNNKENKNIVNLVTELLVIIFSLNILLNLDIEKYNG